MKNLDYDRKFRQITQKIAVIEEELFKKDKAPVSTMAQRILLMKHTGVLETIENLGLQQNHKAQLIAAMIGLNAESVEKIVRQLGMKQSSVKSESNYSFLVDLFDKLKMPDHSKKAEKELISIRQKEK